MPRLSPSLFRKASAFGSNVSRLLPVCRDIPSAQNELRWLDEHATHLVKRGQHEDRKTCLRRLVRRRAHGEPLQYILGSEYFGDLEIKCRTGVLIPRPDTAVSISHLVSLISRSGRVSSSSKRLKVLDLCTGSGCIPLLFHHEFYKKVLNRTKKIDLVGVDISKRALALSKDNQRLQLQAPPRSDVADSPRLHSLSNMRFIAGDVLKDPGEANHVCKALYHVWGDETPLTCDVLLSNPPYVSSKSFRTVTAPSVRHYEPKLALVPSCLTNSRQVADGDAFYPKILSLAKQLESNIILLEVADIEQAVRVASMAIEQSLWAGVEIWRDEPDGDTSQVTQIDVNGSRVTVKGSGHGRSVFAYRREGSKWLGLSHD
ncbi:hypothetical protein D0863_13838 [Hortaea werneckii]|uniref:Release factor glutamine methyltransferase N-terminal domain-containing protein n=1 Tax=Hortaea werneckii TaxID=91943 RepID=A0A3M7CPA1_HORWE|nr:hypothetical protein D0863_13838 [Hortaea werneckii]